MADVFISYHRSDSASALVRRIVDELERMGISCWYDKKDPQLGDFISVITDKIEQCKIFLLLWDEGANKSNHCIHETYYAAFSCAKSVLIVPFQIGQFTHDKTLSYCVGMNQIMFDMDELIKKIAAEFGKTPTKIIQSGDCGAYGCNVTYELDENGTLTISGLGPMRNCYWDEITGIWEMPWWDKRNMIFRAQILNDVTSIGEGSFFGCGALASLKISESVTSIRAYAFTKCVGLSNVKIPNSMTSIDYGAFGGCTELASVNIPNSVISIGRYAFLNCENLKSVSVPAEAEIGKGAFPETTKVIRRPRK